MHVLMIGTDRNLLEANSAVQKRSKHYASLLDRLDIIVFGAHVNEEIVLSQNCSVYPIKRSFKPFQLVNAIRIALTLVNGSTVISTQDAFEVGFVGFVIKKLVGCALHVQIHIDFFSNYFIEQSLRQRIQSKLANFLLRKADGIRVVSDKIRRYITDELKIDPRKVTLAPVFVDVVSAQSAPITTDLHKVFPEFEWIVLMASRYVKQKNIPLAIESFSRFRDMVKGSVGLVIAGSGPEEMNYRKYVFDNKLEGCVKVGSWVKEFASCMKTCDAFLLSSDYEGFAMTIVEAASLGKPVIMTDVGCAGEFLINNKNGIVVPVRDGIAITNSLISLYNDRDLVGRLSCIAKADAEGFISRESNDHLILLSWNTARDYANIAK